jgi:hypothetical protein
VLHALAGPFDARDGDVSFKLQHKTNRGEIITLNGTLIAIALSDYDGRTRIQYDYLSGQDSSNGNITTDSSSLTAVYDAKTADRVRVSPELKSQARVFVGANFNNSTPVPATVTYDIAKGGASQIQAVKRVTGRDDIGAGSLFGISDDTRPRFTAFNNEHTEYQRSEPGVCCFGLSRAIRKMKGQNYPAVCFHSLWRTVGVLHCVRVQSPVGLDYPPVAKGVN